MPRMTQRQRDQLNDIAMARRKKEGKKTYSDADLATVQMVTKRLTEGLEPPRPDPTADFWKYFGKSLNRHKSQIAAQLQQYNKALMMSGPITFVIDDIHPFDAKGLGHDDTLDATSYAMGLYAKSVSILDNNAVIKINCIA